MRLGVGRRRVAIVFVEYHETRVRNGLEDVPLLLRRPRYLHSSFVFNLNSLLLRRGLIRFRQSLIAS